MKFINLIFVLFLNSSALLSQNIYEFNALEHNKPLINPYSGCVNYGIEVSYGYREIPNYIYPESIVYLRPCWAQLEPQDGVFDFSLFDKIKNEHLKCGAKQWACRLVTVQPVDNKKYPSAAPEWLESICKGTKNEKKNYWEPYYGDSIYLSRLERLIKEFVRRYDKDPTLAWVDISGLGLYSEWGDPDSTQPGWENIDKQNEDTKKIVNIFLKNFKHTNLCISSHILGINGEDRYSLKYAIQAGAWFRRDGVGSPFYHKGHKQMAEEIWKDRPIITEWYGPYSKYNDSLTTRNNNWSGWNFTDAVDQALDQHGLVAEMSRCLDKTDAVLKHPSFKTLAEKIGYRLVLSKAIFEKKIHTNDKLIIKQIWKNQGVAKLYVKHPLKVYLFDNQNNEVWSGVDVEFDPTDWSRGNMYTVYSKFDIPQNLKTGTYKIKIALVDENGQPAIELAQMGDRNKNRIYEIGEIELINSGTVKQNINASLNLARIPGATGHVETQNEERPFYFVYPLNDGIMRVSVSDAPGSLHNVRQSYGITWDKPHEFNCVKLYTGSCIKGEGGFWERDLWLEVLIDNKWEQCLTTCNPIYPFNETAGNKVFTFSFNAIKAQGVRVGGFVGRRYSKWASISEIEVYNQH